MKRSRRIAAEVWPARGVYFFPEEGEVRTETGGCPRIVCVGTHALKDGSYGGGSRSTADKPVETASPRPIFRLIVGAALIRRDTLPFQGNSAKANIKDGEVPAPRRRAAPCDPPPSLLATLDDCSCNHKASFVSNVSTSVSNVSTSVE